MTSQVQNLLMLGATGSIGRSCADLVRRDRAGLRIAAASAHRRGDDLAALATEFDIQRLALSDEDARAAFVQSHPQLADRLCAPGDAGIRELIDGADSGEMVVNGLVGAAGLRPTVDALERGLDVALANKEALVVGGQLVLDAARRSGATIWPVDSEHSAIAQCLRGNPMHEVARLWLTASGGSFRDRDPKTLDRVTLEEILAHPTWDMGPKITVDSATMMNKGLEILEAQLLFGIELARIGVVIHRQSIVHSMVEFADGAFLAQLGAPDMRVPILYALSRGEHRASGVAPFDPLTMGSLDFEAPDAARYPCLNLAIRAGEAGGAASVVLNASNEVAVAAVLAEELSFVEIPAIIEACLESQDLSAVHSVDAALERDAITRAAARKLIAGRARNRT